MSLLEKGTEDPAYRWELAWRRVKSVVKEHRKDKKQKETSREDLAMVIDTWRGKLERDNSEENREGFKIASSMVKEKDEGEAKLWRMRSRALWMAEGDAPSKFFMALWKARVKQDEIRALQLEGGEIMEDRRTINTEIGRFYGYNVQVSK
ncbi:hypothetical protein R1sor_020224 [Riccia sorocarpa]|uniref:Uncharacterized protein n=1 Tax=Riccia sorocarpa TaxID=122646 RepID=A0ABD3IHI9_9MARC